MRDSVCLLFSITANYWMLKLGSQIYVLLVYLCVYSFFPYGHIAPSLSFCFPKAEPNFLFCASIYIDDYTSSKGGIIVASIVVKIVVHSLASSLSPPTSEIISAHSCAHAPHPRHTFTLLTTNSPLHWYQWCGRGPICWYPWIYLLYCRRWSPSCLYILWLLLGSKYM